MATARWRTHSFSTPAFAGLVTDLQREFQSDARLPLSEIRSLAKDPNESSIALGLLHLGQKLRLQHPNLAAKIFQKIVESAAPEAVRRSAKQEWKSLSGTGGPTTEILLNQAIQQASDYRFIAPMVAATVVGELAGAAALSRLSTASRGGIVSRGLAARTLSGAAALAPEATVFTVGSRLFQSSAASSFAEDFKSNLLSLGAFKLSGTIGNYARPKLQKLNAGHLAESAIAQGALLLGLYCANRLEGKSPTPTELFASLLGMQAGAHLGNRLLGERFGGLREDLARRVERSNQYRGTHSGFAEFLTPQIAGMNGDARSAPLWMSELPNGKGPFEPIKNLVETVFGLKSGNAGSKKFGQSAYREGRDSSDLAILKDVMSEVKIDLEAGRIRGRLTRPHYFYGIEWPVGTTVFLTGLKENEPRIESFVSPRNIEIQGLPVRRDKAIRFHADGKIQSAVLSRRTGEKHDLFLGEEVHFTPDRQVNVTPQQLKSSARWASRKPFSIWVIGAPLAFTVAGLALNVFYAAKYQRELGNYEWEMSWFRMAKHQKELLEGPDAVKWRRLLDRMKGHPLNLTSHPELLTEPIPPIRGNVFTPVKTTLFTSLYGVIALLLLGWRSLAQRRHEKIADLSQESELIEKSEDVRTSDPEPAKRIRVKEHDAVRAPETGSRMSPNEEDIEAQAELEAVEASQPTDQGRRGNLHAISAPALFAAMDTFANGHPTATGLLLSGLSMLASSLMVAGVFDRVEKNAPAWTDDPLNPATRWWNAALINESQGSALQETVKNNPRAAIYLASGNGVAGLLQSAFTISVGGERVILNPLNYLLSKSKNAAQAERELALRKKGEEGFFQDADGRLHYRMPSTDSVRFGSDLSLVDELIPASQVSGSHATIHRTEGREFHITDLGSQPGTFVDGKRVQGTIPLRTGQTIRLGNLEMTFVDS